MPLIDAIAKRLGVTPEEAVKQAVRELRARYDAPMTNEEEGTLPTDPEPTPSAAAIPAGSLAKGGAIVDRSEKEHTALPKEFRK